MGFLHLPAVLNDSARPSVTAGRADPLLGVICAPAAPPAADVHHLMALAHGGGALNHEITLPVR